MEREGERGRETDRESKRQTDRKTETQTDRDRSIDRQTNREMEGTNEVERTKKAQIRTANSPGKLMMMQKQQSARAILL